MKNKIINTIIIALILLFLTSNVYAANDMNTFPTSISEKQVFRVTARMPSVCGNNVVEEGEICDGGDFSGKTCKSEGFTTGELKCSKDCKNFVTESCSSSQCKDISKQVKDCVESGGQDVTSLDGSGCLVFNECRQSSEVQVGFTKIEKGVIIQIKDNEANIEPTEQELIQFGLRVNSAIFNVDAVETNVDTGVFEAQVKFRKPNMLNGFFSLITGFLAGTPVTYLDVFEGEKLIVAYKGLSVEYVSEGGMQKCSDEYINQAQLCEQTGNTPQIEVNKYGCKELVSCKPSCPEIYAEINQCTLKGGTVKVGRDYKNCPRVEYCELPPTEEKPAPPEEKELTPPSQIYCSFNKPEKENLDLIEISNIGFKGVEMPKSRIEFEVKNKGYSGYYVVTVNAYKFVGNEYLSTYNIFVNSPASGETKKIETDKFIKTEIFDQSLVFEVIGVNGKLLGKKEHELVAPLY